MTVEIKLEGFSELEAELEKLSKAAGKAALRRVLKRRAQPLADAMRSKAPRGETEDLARSVAVSTKLSKRQARMHRKMFKDDRASVEMFLGAGPDPAAWTQEFGTIHHAAQPFARPVWNAGKDAFLDGLKEDLWAEIQKTVARAEARAARIARL
ncbi:HK97-gp10 family putative phage morphogenesis protein [Salipiger sp.]|uniref:HK97-gp10 family putative phage morphogenesis protein n=1 Tax=Salipiger sp. TaxID=2078585 RepID=UPI003A96AC83